MDTTEKSVEYRMTILDEEEQIWTSEMKIPFVSIGLNPVEAKQQCFNIGVFKKGGWFTWVAPGTNLWRVENAGFISFAK